MKKSNRLTLYIIVAMVAGIVLGYVIHTQSSPGFIKSFSTNIKLLTTIFLRLVQMIIAPLVFSTLVVGIAKLGDLKTVGRVGGKAMLWFITASLVSLLLGMLLVNVFQPGEGIACWEYRSYRRTGTGWQNTGIQYPEICRTCVS
jgi:Na+/H+-dicarboxylate symporter